MFQMTSRLDVDSVIDVAALVTNALLVVWRDLSSEREATSMTLHVMLPDGRISCVHDVRELSSVILSHPYLPGTCGPFLHLFTHLGYRKRTLLNTSSMPLDGTPTTPMWPRDLVVAIFVHNLLFRPWSWSRNSSRISTSRRVREPGELLPTLFLFNCTQFIILLMHASFWQLIRIFGSPKKDMYASP
jgi:hypothetical protein